MFDKVNVYGQLDFSVISAHTDVPRDNSKLVTCHDMTYERRRDFGSHLKRGVALSEGHGVHGGAYPRSCAPPAECIDGEEAKCSFFRVALFDRRGKAQGGFARNFD